jgi:hypothetical protein
VSARVRAGPPLGGFSPGGPLLGGPPVSMPEGFGAVPIPGVGVILGEVLVPIPGGRRETSAAPADTGGRSMSTSSALRKGRAIARFRQPREFFRARLGAPAAPNPPTADWGEVRVNERRFP